MLILSVVLPAAALSPDLFDTMLEDAAGRSEGLHVSLEGVGEGQLLAAPPVPDKTPWASAAAPVDLPGESTGTLSGKAVYISQCHGWIWYTSLDGFSTQRGNLFDTIEDFHNPEGTNQYLVRYLENAGARVYTVKERDMNPAMAIVDNTDAGYSESGSGFADGAAGFADASPWSYGEDPFDAGGTRRFPADGGATVAWTVDVPEDGYYAVYVSWDSDSDNATDAHYQIAHPGGVIDRTFDQTVHGSTWQYTEQLWLPEGESLTVTLVADSSQSGRWLSADAVRIGGGYGDVEPFGEPTGRPRWEEGATLHTQFNGAPTSVYDPYGDSDRGSDPSSRSRWAAWEHPAGEPAVYLSWHSNAGGGTGTSTYIYEGDYTPVAGSSEFGALVHEELIDTISTRWDSDWYDRGVRSASFSELSPYHNDEMPAALVELAFHDLAYDADFLKEPGFRRDAARAMARGVIRYFAQQDGVSAAFPPEPPVSVSLLHDAEGKLELSWSAGDAGAPLGDAATSYRVYRSVDGRSWDNGEAVSGTSVVLSAAEGEVVYARVAAVNSAGASFPSEVMGARRSPDGLAPVLVVAGFDRLRASNLLTESIGGSVGTVVRMDLPSINNYDGVIAHGEAVADAGWYFESAADEVVGSLDLDRNRLVFWIAGEESSEDTTFSAAQQQQLASFVSDGGAIWATGAEVLWDLDTRGDDADRAFAQDVLGALLEADDAGTTQATGEGLLSDLLLDFGTADGAPYPVEYPDVLATSDEVVVRYASGGAAGLLGEGRALFGFPFECIGDSGTRAEVAERMLEAMVPDYSPPEPSPEPEDSGGGGTSSLAVPPGTAVPLEELRGCGCQALGAGAGAGVWVGILALLGLYRRQR